MTESKFEVLLNKSAMLVQCEFSVIDSEIINDGDGDFNSVISVSDGGESSVETPASDKKKKKKKKKKKRRKFKFT